LTGVAALAAGLITLIPTPLRAASIICPANIGNNAPISDNVTPSVGCEIGGTNNDRLNPLQVNVDSMFGFNDWIFAEKILEPGDDEIDIGLSFLGGRRSGTWSIDDIWTTLGITDLMLVFKGGSSQNIQPDNYVGYLIASGATSGSYTTPFKNIKGKGNAADISHITAYFRVDQHTVPEPQLLVLFGLGLFLFARRLSRRRPSASPQSHTEFSKI
jgi:hypothetical protein